MDLAVAARASGAPLAPGAARLTPRVEAARAYAQGEVEIFERVSARFGSTDEKSAR